MPKPLTIGVDVRDLRLAKTGTRTYLEELCREFEKMQSDEIRFHFLDTRLPVYTGSGKLVKYTEHFRYQLWKQIVLPLKAFFKRCDVVFCTDTCVPLIHLGYQTIPVFHDAFCFESPQDYGRLWLWLYKNTAVPAAKRSRFVVTPSKWSKDRISHFANIPGDKLVVVYEGPKSLGNLPADGLQQLPASLSGWKGNYILHVGSMYKRKNIPALINALALLKKMEYPDLKLVLAGPVPANRLENDYADILNAIEAAGLTREVLITGYLTDDELAAVYKHALMFVFPSTNEGFGIPVLEAFKYHLPVLVANNTCLPEIGGDAVLEFDPFDTQDIAKKIKTVLDDASLQTAMIARGKARLALFSWKNTAVQLIEIFKKAI